MRKLKPKNKALIRYCDLCGKVRTEKNLLPVSLPLNIHLLTGGFEIDTTDLSICDNCARRIAHILGEYITIKDEVNFERFAQWRMTTNE